jgi:hypothetical protein
MTKTCTRCKERKELNDFHKNGRNKDGSIKFQTTCKTCNNKSNRQRHNERKYYKNRSGIDERSVAEARKYLRSQGVVLYGKGEHRPCQFVSGKSGSGKLYMEPYRLAPMTGPIIYDF